MYKNRYNYPAVTHVSEMKNNNNEKKKERKKEVHKNRCNCPAVARVSEMIEVTISSMDLLKLSKAIG